MKETLRHISVALSILLLLSTCAEEEAIPVLVDFEIAVVGNDHSIPVAVTLENLTFGADSYVWTFEGGDPASSTDFDPGTITYEQSGVYSIKLVASNRDGSLDSLSKEIATDSALVVSFSKTITGSNYPPVTVNFTNTSLGAINYLWTFAEDNTSTQRNPETIVFETAGQHVISLSADNGNESQTVYDTIWVEEALEAAFTYETATLADDDWQAPVTLNFTNTSTSATELLWGFEGGDITQANIDNPVVTFEQAGTYEITLAASNDKTTDLETVSITILEDTNLRTFENLQLGINSAHSTNAIGAFFSTSTRLVYTADEVAALEDESVIDIAFFGLSDAFTFNKFVSPDQVADYTFAPLTGATHTQFINKQESCLCEASMSLAAFEAMTDDSLLAGLTITETEEGLQDFDHTVLPRIVLFETASGTKGAIKINGFVIDGTSSYLVIDLKIQKEAR